MKFISKKNLIGVLELIGSDYISEGTLQKVMTAYGDDYFKDPGDDPWERTRINEEIKIVLGSSYEELPESLR